MDVIYKLLRAGYIENGTFYNTKVGVPQGSIVSPILCNIALSVVDEFLTKLKTEFDKGKRHPKKNPEYRRYTYLMEIAKLSSTRKEYHRKRGLISPFIHNDPNYKRMQWVRYADDILIGIIGSKEDCIIIKKKLRECLINLGLSMNDKKTLITNASKGKAHFLGYEINITPRFKRPYVDKTYLSGRTIRSINITRPILNAPIKDIVSKLASNGYCKSGIVGIPTRCTRLIREEQITIINHYLALGRGILGYYRLATNYNTLKHRIWYILYYSCVLTLGQKFRLRTISKTIKKLGFNLAVYKEAKNGKKELAAQFNRKSFDNIIPIKSHWDFTNLISKDVNINPLEYIELTKYRLPRTINSLNAPCIVCNSTTDIELHHLKHIRKSNLKWDYLTSRMSKINRKQVPLCKNCHIKVHSGKYNGPGL